MSPQRRGLVQCRGGYRQGCDVAARLTAAVGDRCGQGPRLPGDPRRPRAVRKCCRDHAEALRAQRPLIREALGILTMAVRRQLPPPRATNREAGTSSGRSSACFARHCNSAAALNITSATDESQAYAAVVDGSLLGRQSSHARADQLTAAPGVIQQRRPSVGMASLLGAVSEALPTGRAGCGAEAARQAADPAHSGCRQRDGVSPASKLRGARCGTPRFRGNAVLPRRASSATGEWTSRLPRRRRTGGHSAGAPSRA